MKKFLLVLGSIILLLFSSQEVLASSLNLSPSTSTPRAGEEFWVEIHLDTQYHETLGTDVILTFDPQFLEVKEIKEGKLYPSYPGKKIDNNQGRLYLSGVANYGNPVSASGVFGTIKFITKKAGETTLSIDWESGKTNLTNIVPYRGSSNLLTNQPKELNLSIKERSLWNKFLDLLKSFLERFALP